MRKSLLIACCLTLLAALVPSAAGAAASFGIADNNASTFTSPLYKPLKLKYARYIAPWDVMNDAAQLQKFDGWYKAATGAGQKVLVSFEHSRTAGKQRTVPTNGQFKAAMQAFRKAYPKIKEINTWNEVNACQKAGQTERQPTGICKASKAKVLYGFYKIQKQVFKGATIIPVNVLDDAPISAKGAVAYIKAFRKVAKPAPSIWGVHNYSDTNRRSTKRLQAIRKALPKNAKIWLLETGGQLKFGGTTGMANSLKCMFYAVKKYTQIKRAYIFQFNASPAGAAFDAGITNLDGSKRPGYDVVRKRTAKKC